MGIGTAAKKTIVPVLGRVADVVGDALSPGSIDGTTVRPKGWFAHWQAVDRLRESFDAVPSGERVRLAKRTSNLFRGRAESSAPGLDVSGLGGVIAVDPVARTADVQGMCTYEHLVDATLAYGLAPLVVPQLKTITLGGAVTGMGVESTCFRNGLPHESVIEMDVLTGTGEIVTASRTQNEDLFRGFPNSYGSLGYAVRLKIELEPVEPFVELRYVRFDDVESLSRAVDEISRAAEYDGERVDYLDGVVFSLDEAYLVLGRQSSQSTWPPSDYTRERSYYRAIQHPSGVTRDLLTIRDYLWRWDIDWFWCSRAFGTQNPTVRTLWPRELRRSSFYWKLIGLDRRFDIADRIEARAGRPARERVVQDIEVEWDRLPEFLRWFFTSCEIEPVWLCPIRLRDQAPEPWPLYPIDAGRTWVNVGFWSSVPVDLLGDDAPPGAFNRAIEAKVRELDGHKSLYSESFYSREEFDELYNGALASELKGKFDPDGRFPGMYEKTVRGA